MEFNIINFCETDIKKKYNNNLDLKSQFPQQDLCYINLHKKEIKEIVNPPEVEREESNVKPYDPYNRYHPSL
jgi:hypothetical protein